MIIGVTGGLATGTSTAAGHIASYLKAGIISADKIAHSHIKGDKPFIKKVILHFGKDIIGKHGFIDRKRLAEKAFSKKAHHNALCQMAHPVIVADINSRIKKLSMRSIKNIVIDGAMIIESGFYKRCDYVIVVTSSLSLQVKRCENKKIGAKDALSRIRFQVPLCQKVKYADYIIDNSGDLKDLRLRCKKISEKIKTGRVQNGYRCRRT
jgi:dephospho-CoA kinase